MLVALAVEVKVSGEGREEGSVYDFLLLKLSIKVSIYSSCRGGTITLPKLEQQYPWSSN